MKEISLYEFHKEYVTKQLADYFGKDIIYDDKEYCFYYLKEKKDFYGNEYYIKRAIVSIWVEWGIGNEFNQEDMNESDLHFFEPLPFRIIKDIMNFYETLIEV